VALRRANRGSRAKIRAFARSASSRTPGSPSLKTTSIPEIRGDPLACDADGLVPVRVEKRPQALRELRLCPFVFGHAVTSHTHDHIEPTAQPYFRPAAAGAEARDELVSHQDDDSLIDRRKRKPATPPALLTVIQQSISSRLSPALTSPGSQRWPITGTSS
jgi:hypothetical protein